MAEALTSQQKTAVSDRGGKLLVSAAAGSGKTKVLVDRLLLYLTEGGGSTNIDDFLIITYTKAAAAELRGKIAAKLNERLAQDPGNKHLRRQIQRLYLTKISTVHAFCGDILREYAYRLDIPGDFRIADERECQILQLQVLDKIMETSYEQADEAFLSFINSHELRRDDRAIPMLLLQVYNSAQCHIDPDKWLEECIASSIVTDISDVSHTVWGKYLITDLHKYLDMQIAALTRCAERAEQNGSMEKPAALLRETICQLRCLRQCASWDEIVHFGQIDYGRLTFPKDCTDPELAERIKTIRKACKAGVDKKLKPFADKSEQVIEDLRSESSAIQGLVSLVRHFTDAYRKVKKSRRILDFSDLEHNMLDLVIGKDRRGNTVLADEIGNRFVEIMVDEYQDSNSVQDAIFSALTAKKQNCFMVGDVKQSIYQFRLADPSIFLEKYNTYVPANIAKPGQGRMVTLSNNFRSAGAVIDAVNDVFCACMSKTVGGLDYGPAEQLNEGIPHIPLNEPEIELSVISVQKDTYAEEAAYTADRIAELLNGTHMIRNGNELRPITAGDIVILLRSPGSVGAEFAVALESRGIQMNAGSGIDLLQTEEIGFVRSMLQIISNPMQDIPLIAALSSKVLCFTADDLAVIRSGSRRRSFYEALQESGLEKAKTFIQALNMLRKAARLCTLSELIDRIYGVTHMDSIFAAMPNGEIKTSNLQSFYRLVRTCEASNFCELDQFLDYLDSLEEKGLLAADEGGSSGVTIMSIHKSKGLEFPVVFLCGLSRDFNREDVRAQVLCHKELGIGVNCVDLKNRVRYPSVAKKAIAAKILAEAQSEEMRVLYVAMTRAKDRLIMTYAVKNPDNELSTLVSKMDMCDSELLTAGASCPGTWILMTALRRTEAGALFALGGRPEEVIVSQTPWKINVCSVAVEDGSVELPNQEIQPPAAFDVAKLQSALGFQYGYKNATVYPSKQTATQLKGRIKDQEAAENATSRQLQSRTWKRPSFAVSENVDGVSYGNAVHAVMQHIRYEQCDSLDSVKQDIQRMVDNGLLESSLAEIVDVHRIWDLLSSPTGVMLRNSHNIIREFKFSILDDAEKYGDNLSGEKILLQGVVDCAVIEDDGVTVLDFKTDRVTDDTVDKAVSLYCPQVTAYAEALSRIYEKDIKSAQLYFFALNRFVKII